ncbi:hypothetical protein BGX27_007329 [Mortierella sp. AM989]|nr:hypothetical protein BGX27_007329 [Mortierella sp. AM989]
MKPWLPPTIEPVRQPKTTVAPSPGTSLPDVVIPNMHPMIPDNSFNVLLRLEHVSYYQVIYNSVLAAQLVSFIPAQLSTLLDVDINDILVLAIRDASSSSNGGSSAKFRKRDLVTTDNENDAILLTISIPKNTYWSLNKLVVDQHSSLYTVSDVNFGQYVDPTFPLSRNPPPNTLGSDRGTDPSTLNPVTGDEFGSGDPNTVIPGGNKPSSNPSNSALIVSLVGLATVAYVGIALVVLRSNRRKKEKEESARIALQRSISAPINVQG